MGNSIIVPAAPDALEVVDYLVGEMIKRGYSRDEVHSAIETKKMAMDEEGDE